MLELLNMCCAEPCQIFDQLLILERFSCFGSDRIGCSAVNLHRQHSLQSCWIVQISAQRNHSISLPSKRRRFWFVIFFFFSDKESGSLHRRKMWRRNTGEVVKVNHLRCFKRNIRSYSPLLESIQLSYIMWNIVWEKMTQVKPFSGVWYERANGRQSKTVHSVTFISEDIVETQKMKGCQ